MGPQRTLPFVLIHGPIVSVKYTWINLLLLIKFFGGPNGDRTHDLTKINELSFLTSCYTKIVVSITCNDNLADLFLMEIL